MQVTYMNTVNQVNFRKQSLWLLSFKGSRRRLCRPLGRHHQRDHSVPRKKSFTVSCFVLLRSTPKILKSKERTSRKSPSLVHF